jgi:hypothetical protein
MDRGEVLFVSMSAFQRYKGVGVFEQVLTSTCYPIPYTPVVSQALKYYSSEHKIGSLCLLKRTQVIEHIHLVPSG